jgi:regulator of cell morphogenesis and NO signaling
MSSAEGTASTRTRRTPLGADADRRWTDSPDLAKAPLAAVCQHVIERHHAYLRRELPRLSELIVAVERAHRMDDHRLEELQNVFERLRAEMEAHMVKEERVLFPACRALEFGRHTTPVQAPVTMLEHEHLEARDAIRRLRDLTDGFDADRALGREHRLMVSRLAALAADTDQHVHTESTLLFRRALALSGR